MTTTTRQTLPPALMSWIEHTAPARQLGYTTTTAPALPVTVPTPVPVVPVAIPTVATDAVPSGVVLLKILLCRRHWQTYRTFCRQYDKAAATIDDSLIGRHPSRAQLHRWLSGSVKGLPYSDHCRVLEAMFPGYTAAQLMAVTP